MPDIATALDAILSDILMIEAVAEDVSMANTETWDSANHLRIVLALEEEFSIRFTIADIETMTRRDRILGLISSKL